jgi:hypothetical protein
MHDIRECRTVVICPLYPWHRETIYTKVTTDADGRPFAHCNGCDNMNTCVTCQRCTATITLMYMSGEPFPTQPFSPPLDRFAPMP